MILGFKGRCPTIRRSRTTALIIQQLTLVNKMAFIDNRRMKLFQKNKTHKSNIYMPGKYKKTEEIKKRRKRLTIFKKSKNNGRNIKKLPSKNFFLVLLAIFFLGIVYLSIIYINKLRNTDSNNEYDNVMIIGIDNVPVYPESTFIFENTLNEPSVSKFLSEGNSAYRLPPNTSFSEVVQFYNTKLPNYGWQFVLSVSIGSEDMKSGEYWTREGKGLRIYYKFNDIWYESIAIEEAQTGLAQQVKDEVARNLLLADSNTQDLLPDFPWIIEIPKEYVISYSVSSYKSESTVSFKRLGSSETVSLTPIAGRYSKAFDFMLDDYVKDLNKKNEEQWGVKNTFIISTNTGNGIRGSIGMGDELREIAVIQNPYNDTAYVLDSNIYKSPFFDYILSNLEPQSKIKY